MNNNNPNQNNPNNPNSSKSPNDSSNINKSNNPNVISETIDINDNDESNIYNNKFSKFKYKHKRLKSHKKNRRLLQNQIKEDINYYNKDKVQYIISSSNNLEKLQEISDIEDLGKPIRLIKVSSLSTNDLNTIPMVKVNSFSSKDKVKEYKDNIRKSSSINLLEGFITEITGIANLNGLNTVTPRSKSNNNFFSALNKNNDKDVNNDENDEENDEENDDDENENNNKFNIITETIKNKSEENEFILEGIDIEEYDDKSLNQSNQSNQSNNKKKNKKKEGNKQESKINSTTVILNQAIPKSINEIRDLDKKMDEVTDYNLIHTPFKMIGEELLNEEINIKYRSKSKGLPENQLIIKKLKENFRKMVMGDIKDKPNLSKILLDNTLPEDVKLRILRKYIKYSTEDEVFSESADRIRNEINNLLKIKKIRTSNDYDEIYDKIDSKIMPSNLKLKLEDMYYRIITGDESKLSNLVHNIIKLPYHRIPNILDKISEPDTPRDEQITFIKSIYKTLDDNLFGLSEVKDSIISYICQRINNPEIGSSKYLCLCGPAGVGKTSIVHAISEALKIPYSYISLANIDVPSTLIGHDYTYEGSTHGCIADAVIKNGCSNGIILFDELDKCKEKVHNTLLGIFDPLQNSKFRDAYFGNFHIDLSQSMMIICLNDLDKINPILRDRLHIIHIPGYSGDEKRTIVNKYILPKLESQYKINIQIEKEVIDYIITNTSQHKGIRQLIMYLTKIYELVILDKFTDKFKFGEVFKLKDLTHIKLQEDSSNKILSTMYV